MAQSNEAPGREEMEEIDLEQVCNPPESLAWSCQYLPYGCGPRFNNAGRSVLNEGA